jgi:hypothetical protein
MEDTMSRRRTRDREIHAARALDRLVLDVVRTLGGSGSDVSPPRRQAPDTRPARPTPPASAAVLDPVDPGQARGPSSREAMVGTPAAPRSPVSPPGRDRDDVVDPGLMPADEPGLGEDGLLDQEEEEFVTRTAEWLGRRTNADELLAMIWTLVTQQDPDRFYRPAGSPSAADEQAAADDGIDGETEMADPTDE